MDEAEDVVEVLARDRVARVRMAAHQVRGLRGGEARGHERHLAARAHDLGKAAIRGFEDVAEDASLVGGQALVRHHQVAQLLFRHLLRGGGRVATHEADDGVRGHREEPHHRAHEPGEDVERRPDRQGDAGGALQREALGREFAQHEGEVGDHERQAEQAQGLREVLRDAGVHQRGHEVRGQGGRAVGGREEAGDRDADLDGGEEPVRVARHRRHPSAPMTLALEPGDLALAERDEGEFGAGEEPADEDEGEHQQEGHPGVLVHQVHPRPGCSVAAGRAGGPLVLQGSPMHRSRRNRRGGGQLSVCRGPASWAPRDVPRAVVTAGRGYRVPTIGRRCRRRPHWFLHPGSAATRPPRGRPSSGAGTDGAWRSCSGCAGLRGCG